MSDDVPGVESNVEGPIQGEVREAGEPLTYGSEPIVAPLTWGRDSEVVPLDWFGDGSTALLVSAITAPGIRVARIHRPVETVDGRSIYDEGTEVLDLFDLRRLCPIPTAGPARFDLLAEDGTWLHLLRNNGTANEPRFDAPVPLATLADLGLGDGRISHMIADDWEGDGRQDLLVGFDEMTGYWPEAGIPPHHQVGFNERGGHPGYDRNGLWRGKPPRGRLLRLRNNGEPGRPDFATAAPVEGDLGRLAPDHSPAFLVVSWGGGRGFELLVTDARNTVRLHRNFGGQRPPVLMDPRELKVGGASLHLPDDRTTLIVGDIDGDRRPELLHGTADGRVFAVHASGRDDATPPEPIRFRTKTLRMGGGTVVTALDLDNDGDVDLIAGDAAGRLWMSRNLGSREEPRFGAPIELDAGGNPFRLDPGPDGTLNGPIDPRLGWACPALVDWTNHGRPDLIVGGAGGEILYLKNNGALVDPRWDRPVPLRCDGGPLITPPRVRPAVADWMGTGETDVIALDLQGFLCVYPRAGEKDLGRPVQLTDRLGRLIRLDGAFGLGGRCNLWAGPWTGSGRPDILVGLGPAAHAVVSSTVGEALGVAGITQVLLLENLGRNQVAPRPVLLADGSPILENEEGCSPLGVSDGSGRMDLWLGTDDGRVVRFRRDDLRW